MLLMLAYTISKAVRRVITPLWALIELAAWIVIGIILWYLRLTLGTEIVLTALMGILIILFWGFTRHVRELREDLSRLNEEIARR